MKVPYNESYIDSQESRDWYSTYFNTTPDSCESFNYESTSVNDTDIYIPSFNNSFFIEYQIKTLRLFFDTPYNLIIVDNNNQLYPTASVELLEICKRENVTYLKAPDNYHQTTPNFDSSMKLGTTLSWIFHNCVKVRKPKYFGILDHDCFLIEKYDITEYLDKMGMYGRVCKSPHSDAWNLHVTNNFYKFDFVKDYPLDFRASHKYQLDTNGANYEHLFNKFNHEDYMISIIGHRYNDVDVNRKDSVQHFEFIDSKWYHVCASTHDQLVGDGIYKLAYTRGFLDSRITAENKNTIKI